MTRHQFKNILIKNLVRIINTPDYVDNTVLAILKMLDAHGALSKKAYRTVVWKDGKK